MSVINGTPRPVRPPLPTVGHTAAVRRPRRQRPSRRRALALAVTAALLAGMSMAVDEAVSTASATTPTPPGISSKPIGTGAGHRAGPLVDPTGIGPSGLDPTASI